MGKKDFFINWFIASIVVIGFLLAVEGTDLNNLGAVVRVIAEKRMMCISVICVIGLILSFIGAGGRLNNDRRRK